MSHVTFTCAGCDNEQTVELGTDERRCVVCGTKHTGPWDDPRVVSSPVMSDEEIQAANAEGVESSPAPSGSNEADVREQTEIPLQDGMVRITIEIVPQRSGEP